MTQLMLRRPAVQAATGRCRSSIQNDVRSGLFTRPVSVGARSVAWPSSEVSAIVAARTAGWTDDQLRDLVKRLHAARAEAVAGLGLA